VLRSADRLAPERVERREQEREKTRAEPERAAGDEPETRRRGSMDRAEIETRVKKVLAEQLAVDEQQVVPDARFAEDLNADSLDLVEAVLALEEEWSIEIPEDEMESVKTVGQAVDLVAGKLGMS
jgi:acyl carrier protein